MPSRRQSAGRRGSPDAIILDLVLLTFVAAIVSVAWFQVAPDARLFPLIVGIPLLAGLGVQLFGDLLPQPVPDTTDTATDTAADTVADNAGNGPESSLGQRIGLVGSGPNVRLAHAWRSLPEASRRKIAFSIWATAFFALSVVVSFLASIPLALLFFLRIIARERWLTSILITVAVWGFFWLVFGVLLDVQL